ncbi:MetQ/NlpA family ABC transporter substrate-binding protein [Xinfangfangia sp. D13-10-4-6]|uniref:MetQ/NlpA family ABC transporter substrate-binding protein n=1 Tax=Pseudogemmobacter hezensis TaxID=2737662 RepID=UPI001554EB67|nr:MetQ/NlpA family ABC transporter substrate-binding protein [Pseudogemmobacter hezensis]NPD16094.1 MetQ/NlpA family ABC transporter substrate-binding protein [Pseudogemmobacter hezensis]
MRKSTRLASSLALVAALWAAPALADLKIGVTPGVVADSVITAAEEAKAQGLAVEVIEFADWATPNLALSSGDLDLNFFQHQAFLENAVKETGFDLVPVAPGFLPNIGLYSLKYDSLEALPDGAKVAVANDPVNQGRALVLLANAGLIGLKDGVGYLGTLDDVTDNPKNLTFVEIEGPQLVRAIEDVDLAQGYPAHYVSAGNPDLAGQALAYSGVDETRFAIAFVSRRDNAEDPEIARFVEIYQSAPSVEAKIAEYYAGNPILYSLPWK